MQIMNTYRILQVKIITMIIIMRKILKMIIKMIITIKTIIILAINNTIRRISIINKKITILIRIKMLLKKIT